MKMYCTDLENNKYIKSNKNNSRVCNSIFCIDWRCIVRYGKWNSVIDIRL